MNTSNFKTNPKTILELSKRTVQKIIKRSNLKCALCNWDQACGDIHHIIELSQGGSNHMSNLVYVCPNCHRCIHQNGDFFITKEKLLEVNLEKTLPNWLELYNPKNKTNIDKSHKKCLSTECNNLIPHNMIYCSQNCAKKDRQKFNWNKEALEILLQKHHGVLTSISKDIQISDNAIKKQCAKFGLNPSDYRIKSIRSKIFQATI